jgi:hypothetical protein
MRYIIAATVISLFTAVSFSATDASTRTSDPTPLTVHEWGTFTSIAGPDGAPVEWHPLGEASDLPCFVERSVFNIKGSLAGTVRMETPVLYFYAPREANIDVRVRFRSGLITEWFPHASVAQSNAPMNTGTESRIAWKNVQVSPGSGEDFRVEPGASHYYTARRTNAAPIRSGSQTDKFLFYRGVGRFALPIAAVVDSGGRVSIRNEGPAAIDEIILFSNVHGRIHYDVLASDGSQMIMNQTTNDQEPWLELQQLLMTNHLYPEEASAMIETWRDSWFEEGTRLFYIVPRSVIDSILPLDINPPADDVVRVFVARTEVFTPAMESEIANALLNGDGTALRKYGRFLEAIGRAIVANAASADRPLLEQRLQNVFSTMRTLDRCAN